ncbi:MULTISPECIES: hypothetical protein [unclassified Nostoc]|uniref:hypothetical protein n=1 Tax=unclassified Nostoc TaxID=2593658 RepID=UPI002639219A|nr:hypothetical protein [Nostoc sp. S13]MDF5735170.1 hypothetical protein [Nostoc sp. S13]
MPIPQNSPNVELLTIYIKDARSDHGADTGARTDYHPEWCPAIGEVEHCRSHPGDI